MTCMLQAPQLIDMRGAQGWIIISAGPQGWRVEFSRRDRGGPRGGGGDRGGGSDRGPPRDSYRSGGGGDYRGGGGGGGGGGGMRSDMK